MARIVECPHCGAEVNRDRRMLCPECKQNISRKPARPRSAIGAPEARRCASQETSAGRPAGGDNTTGAHTCRWEDCGATLPPGAERCPYCERVVGVQDDSAILRIGVGGADAKIRRGETVVIGRDSPPLAEALSSLDHISRRHVRIEYGEDGVWISDMGSANGTYVEGRRLEPWQRKRIEPGTALRLASNVAVDVQLGGGSVRAP